MIIETITIENFRSYFGAQTLNLAEGLSADRNIVAIGGLNGAGKTTLHDAITFGLLGHSDAFRFVKGIDRKGDNLRLIQRELNQLINREAHAAGAREARVTLSLLDNQGERFAIRRTWQYDARSTFQREELLVARAGAPDKADQWEADVQEQFSDFLKNHVPREVAKFFIFDGEEIRRIAQDEPESAVREGIDSLLGFHVLDTLASDMEKLQDDYRTAARKRSRQEEELDELKVQERKLDNQRQEQEEERLELEERVEDLKEQNARLVEELSRSLGTGGKDPKELQAELELLTREIQQGRDAMLAAVDRQLIPALPGSLVQSLVRQLDEEEALAQWDEGKRKVEPQRERLIRRLFAEGAPQAAPPLEAGQTDFLRGRIREEWDQLFNPPPAGIAEYVIHGYLSAEDRTQVRGRCTEILRAGAIDLQRMINDLDTLERRDRDVRLAMDRIGDGKRINEIVAEKSRVDKELREAEIGWEDRKRRVSSLLTDLKELRKQIRNKADELVASGASAARADLAKRVRRAVELYREALRPRKRDDLARYLGEMYRHLARKEDVVQRIELDEKSFGPRLLDRRGGTLSLDTQSAGEKEIYALSLLWALGKTSKRELPVVIDTPLARLDSAHRSNIVKRYLPQAGRQVIVLSTDTEIDRQYFELIEHHIARSLRLEFDPKTERTTVKDGYFEF